ncbi:hypothetical protein ACFLSQ_05595 [Bacteroidota bacterium]
MKKIIILLAAVSVVIFLSCYQEQATQTQQKIDLSAILSDSNWVEITDTVDVTDQIKCLAQPLIQNKGTVFQSENDYKDLWEKSVTEYPDMVINCYGVNVYDSTKVKYQIPDINFNERTVLGYSIVTGPAKWTRCLYMNEQNKLYLHLVHVEIIAHNFRGDGYWCWVSVPKIPDNYKIMFDTTVTDSIR